MKELTKRDIRTFSRLGQRGSIFGLTLAEALKEYPNIMALTADLASLSGMERYVRNNPDNFLNIGIAEQNMMGISAGLASEGYLPVVTTYATFISLRSAEMIRHFLGYMKQKVVVIGSGAGLVQAYSGATHYSIEDMSLIRAIPNITILSPCDASSAIKAFYAALENNQATYIRLTGGLNCPIVYKDDFDFQIGKANIIEEGSDIVIFATGTILSYAMQARELLAQQGISVKVVDMHTIKPIDKEVIKNNLSAKLYVSVEEHNIIGGLGSAIAEVMSENSNIPYLLRLGILDKFDEAGDHNFLLEQNRLSVEMIYEDILNQYNQL